MDRQGRTTRLARVMHYSHDTFGLGHLRRTLTIAHHLRSSFHELTQLIVTGSPVAHDFHFPPGTDYIKLPAVTKNGAGQYESRSLASSIDEMCAMRSDLLLSAARHFRPDVLLVDHAPAGLAGEALPTLRYLREASPHTRLVLGLRDIVDDAASVRRAWSRDGVYDLLDTLYDRILVYGERQTYDVIEEYGLSTRAAGRTRFVGYLGRGPGPETREEVRTGLGMQTDRLVVVTAGGGGDGVALMSAMLDAMAGPAPPFDCLLIGGHLMDPDDRRRFRTATTSYPHLHFIDSTNDMPSYIGAADAVVSMGGYNTFCEILSLRRPAIIVPRVKPRREQLIRARLFSARGIVRMIHPGQLTADRLLRDISTLVEQDQGMPAPVHMDGLRNAVDALVDLMPDTGSAPSVTGWESTASLPAAASA